MLPGSKNWKHGGESALKSHMVSKRHKERSPSSSNIASFVQASVPKDQSNEKKNATDESNKKKQSSVDQIFTSSAATIAEIRWVLNVVTSKYSMNSSSNSGKLFSTMFPDSEIAKRFQCGPTKAAYVAHFGLAPYFYQLMLSKISSCPYYTISFDESLNSSVQKGQMDFIIRFWNSDTDSVATRYLGSEFMGRSTAEDVLQTFLAGIDDLDQS